MEEITTREQSSDSIATSDEFEDLGHKNATEGKLKEELPVSDLVGSNGMLKASPEMEISNNGSMADLKDTLDEVLNEETETNGTQNNSLPLISSQLTMYLFFCC